MASEEAVMAVIRASRPTFRNPHDKVAFAVHAVFLASGYSLTATGPPAFSDTVLSSPPSGEVGIDGWNQTEDCYGFVYSKNDQDSKNTVLVKCLVMGDHLVIDAISSKTQDKEPISVQINVKDYDGANGSTNFADQYKNFAKLVTTLNSGIVSKMGDSPGTGSSSSTAPPRSERSERSEHNLDEPQNREPLGPRFVFPPIVPGVHDDRLPGPGAGMYPRVGPDIGGPMLIGPNDPRWFRPGGDHPGIPDSIGVPPGARFDPYGPPGVPGFEPNRFARNPRRPPGTHPDLEPFGNPDFI
ncbi:Fbxo7/PI31 domain [Macleaya cordata]|uniref:Fbxo7/PI31 domain n=1 Tax=Macleaya cordata TaxID=56857 RepID=A0A200R4U9_MACCD|nr:Fbxo7/PI31 domain [Macleaya cordata]